jgi:hypothetical protein
MALPLALALAGTQFGGDALSSILGGMGANASADQLRNALEQSMKEGERTYSDVSGMYKPLHDQGMQGFDQWSQGILSGEFDTPERGRFSYDRSVEDFLDPSRQLQYKDIARAQDASAVGSGSLKSGATMQALQDRAQERSMLDYANADARRDRDRAFSTLPRSAKVSLTDSIS